jgi:hypothetical protein
MFMSTLLKDLLTDLGYQVVAEASDDSSAVSLYKEKTIHHFSLTVLFVLYILAMFYIGCTILLKQEV